jgi:trigger factor
MQTVETLNEGLKRAYSITIPAKDIDARVDSELKTIAPQVQMPGFRPARCPANLVRKMHGPALEQQALNARPGRRSAAAAEQKLRPRCSPASARGERPRQGRRRRRRARDAARTCPSRRSTA